LFVTIKYEELNHFFLKLFPEVLPIITLPLSDSSYSLYLPYFCEKQR